METWITVVKQSKGKRSAARFPLQVPLHLAIGRLDLLSNLQIREMIRDLHAEQERRGISHTIPPED